MKLIGRDCRKTPLALSGFLFYIFSMPELPEVETTVNKLKPLIIGKRILEYDRKILGLERRGKAVLINLSGDCILGFHQRMSGRLLIVPRGLKDKYIRHRYKLSNGKDLAFHDVRRFGVVWYGKTKKVLEDNYFKTLGEDALRVSLKNLKKLLNTTPPSAPLLVKEGMGPRVPSLIRRGGGVVGRGIKSFLLDQKNIAGVGNIMADEILWKAKIHPARKISTLNDREIKLLWSSMRVVLQKSIKLGGSTMRDWLHPDGSNGGYFEKRMVYDREGEPCGNCKRKILRKKIAGRSSDYCAKCQKVEKKQSPGNFPGQRT